MPPRTGIRLERDEVLVSQFLEHIGNACIDVLRHTDHAHAAAGPPRKVRKRCGRRRRAIGGQNGQFAARMIERADHCQQVDGNVDRARDA